MPSTKKQKKCELLSNERERNERFPYLVQSMSSLPLELQPKERNVCEHSFMI